MDSLPAISPAILILIVACFCLYFFLSVFIMRRSLPANWVPLAAVAIILHALALYSYYWQPDAALPVTAYCLAIAWLGALAAFARPFFIRATDRQYTGWPYAAIAAVMPLRLLPIESIYAILPALGVHLLLIIPALALLGQAAILALLIAVQEHQLHNRRHGWLWLPALRDMEKLLFHVVLLGFFLLSLGLANGLSFPKQMLYTPHVYNKMFISLGAWFIFGILLWGRWSRGWRGNRAAYWTWGGCLVLTSAYWASTL